MKKAKVKIKASYALKIFILKLYFLLPTRSGYVEAN